MPVQIGLIPFNDLGPISFDDLPLRHLGCTAGKIQKRRDQLNSDYTLSCACGLNLVVPRFGDFTSNVLNAAIDGQPRSIGPGSILSDPALAVDFIPGAT